MILNTKLLQPPRFGAALAALGAVYLMITDSSGNTDINWQLSKLRRMLIKYLMRNRLSILMPRMILHFGMNGVKSSAVL